MQRRAATALHLALTVFGAILYLLFVLPRWWVLTGDIPTTLATAGRIATGVPIALAAVPVALNLQYSLKPEFSTPELALRLRAWSAVLHVLAGVLIILTAIAEIWLGLGTAGPWLFAVYGAAAAIAVLGIATFYLSRVAEKPPAAPKPPKPPKPPQQQKEKRRSGKRGGKSDEAVTPDESATPEEITDEVVTTAETSSEDSDDAEAEIPVIESEIEVVETDAVETESVAPGDADESAAGGLRNKRPTGKSRHRLPR